jgi:hypothetical protein
LLGVNTAIRDARTHTQESDKAALNLTKKTRAEQEVYELRQAVRALTQAVEGVYEDALARSATDEAWPDEKKGKENA